MRQGDRAPAAPTTTDPATPTTTDPVVPTTILDCSGVGPGGITRVLTEVVRHWPPGHRLEIVAAPGDWACPGPRRADVVLLGRQDAGRARSIASAAAALRRATTRRYGDRAARVLSLSPSLAIRYSRLPVVTLVHDLAFRLWPRELPAPVLAYRRLSYATAIRRSQRLICVSARTRHDLLGLYGVPPATTRVWHPGSDLAAAGPGGPPPEVARVAARGAGYLVVAGHAPHKGVELAIEAMEGLPDRVLVVLTGGQPVAPFRAAGASSPAADRILFLDRLTDTEYAATLAGAAAFLMPSHFEGYGLPAVEALRLGTPTIISPDPALHEATGGAAIRMTTWTARALRDAVRTLGDVSRPAVRPGRSWREATEHLVALLADVRPRPPAAGPDPDRGGPDPGHRGPDPDHGGSGRVGDAGRVG